MQCGDRRNGEQRKQQEVQDIRVEAYRTRLRRVERKQAQVLPLKQNNRQAAPGDDQRLNDVTVGNAENVSHNDRRKRYIARKQRNKQNAQRKKRRIHDSDNGVLADPSVLFYKAHRSGGEHAAYKRADRKRYADYVRNGNTRNHRMR